MGNTLSDQTASSVERISPIDRAHRIEGASRILRRHLREDIPIVLPPDLRWAIVEETRHCWTNCKVCITTSSVLKQASDRQATQQYRLRGSLFEEIMTAGHSFSDRLPFKVTGQSSWPRIRNIVHAIIHHQSRLDARWYRLTINALDTHSSLIPKQFQGERREHLAASLFAEILAVTAAAHMLNVSLCCLGIDTVSSLAKTSQIEKKHLSPTYSDIGWNGMIKRGRSFRHNEKVVHTPYVLTQDYDRRSSAWQELEPDEQDYLSEMMVHFHPLIGLSIVPHSLFAVANLANEISLSDQQFFELRKDLDPKKFCSDGFSMDDFAALAQATASIYGTSYYCKIHDRNQVGLASFQEATPRQVLLIVLAKVLACRPLVKRDLDNIMQRLRLEHGDATAVEAAGGVSLLQAYSKITHATGRLAISRPIAILLPHMIRLRRSSPSAA